VLAWLTARTTVYTLTNKRVVTRIGIVLTVTFNLPLAKVASAALRPQLSGCGDICLALSGADRIAWLHLWPHVRPWKLARPEPMLRMVPDAARVAGLLSQAWSAVQGGAAVVKTDAAASATTATTPWIVSPT
jgi:Bacterial PH domain